MPEATSGDEKSTASRFPTVRALGKGARQTGRLRSFWKKNGRGLLILLLVLAVAHASVNIYASVLLNRELAELRQKGEPLTIVDLAPPQVPESRNAAPVYKQAIGALRLTKNEEQLLSNSFETNSPLGAAGITALKKNQQSLQLTRQAAARPECRFPIDWNASPIQILLPHYAEVRQLARLLRAQAVQSARTGDTSGALSDVRAIFRISDHVSREPILIGFLVSRAINALAYKTLAEVLESSPVPASQARSFLSSLPQTDWSAAYRRTLLAERTFTLWAFNTVSSDWNQARQAFVAADTPGPLQVIASPLGLLWRPFLKLDEVYALRLWKRSLAAVTPMQVPAPPDAGGFAEGEGSNGPGYAVITRTMFPTITKVRQHRDAIEVSQRQMEVVLALSAYRSTKGRYPAQLQQAEQLWGKALPTDPYSNKPFIYQSDGRNFTLYSIGANRIDEKGRGPSQRSVPVAGSQTGDDILWNPKSDN